ncbi:hypothetical protein [Marinomonas gallaica]|uniref:hypothetical protein n=1 Tax=Marinomonas gallaica TaxID=1806667 RepID=UPI00082F0CC0|nr:hypothetical protein [Marinomonas gallaica]
MGIKDYEWWACCTMLGAIFYTLGTLVGYPIWSSDTDAMSIMANLATLLAGIGAAIAAFYAYRSFESWPSRQQQQHTNEVIRQKELHRLERSSESLKELSRAYEQTMLELFRFCKQTVNTQAAEGFAKSGGHFIDKYLKQYKDLIEAQNRFMDNLSSYKSAYSSHRYILGEDTIDVYSGEKILKFYEDLTEGKRQFNDGDVKSITEFHNKGTAKIETLFKELYATN